MINQFIGVVSFLLKQNEAQKQETFVLLAIFALIACVLIAGTFAKPFTKEKKVQKALTVIAVMVLFVFFVVYLILKYNK